MAIKMNAKSKTLLTVFLVGSLCGLRASDMNEEGSRLQITGAYELLSAEIAALSTSAQSSGIQGTGFDASTDSLVAISNNTTSVPLATNAQAVAMQGTGVDGTTTAVTGGTTLTASTNNLSSVSKSLSAIEGAGFTSALASQYVNTRQVVLGQVIAAEANAVLVDLYTAGTGGGTYTALNTNLAAISSAITTAMTTQNNANITAIITAINAAQAVMITGAGAPHSAEAVTAGLQSLEFAVNNWLAFYPA